MININNQILNRQKQLNIEVSRINETNLNSEHKIQFENYHLIRKDRF